MSETLYRVQVEGEGVNVRGRILSVDPVGEFRRVFWCKTHDSKINHDEFSGCEQESILLETGHLQDEIGECVLVELWMEES